MAEERTALLKIDPHDNSAYMALVSEVQSFVSFAESASIADTEGRELATNDLSRIAQLKKAIADLRMEYLAPLKTHTDTINAAFKDITDPLAQADTILRQKVLAFNNEQARLKREAEELERQEREVAERRAKLNGDIAFLFTPKPMPVVADQRAITEVGESNTRTIKKWRLIDIRQVPAYLLKLDEVQIGKIVRAGAKEIPGIEIYEEKVLTVEAMKD